MLDTMLSTQEVAALLSVTETTVKRWAEEGRIRCTKTLGGHRKFSLKDIIRFSEEHAYPLTGTLSPPAHPMSKEQMEQLEFGVHTKNFGKISRLFFEESLRGDAATLYALLSYLSKHHIHLSAIADEVVKPALAHIGELWAEGKIDIAQEHRASHAIVEAMVRLMPDLHRKPANGLVAVCACAEGEYHEIGIRSLAYILETEGWYIHYLGADIPFVTLRAFMKTVKPDLLCLSFTVVENRKKFIDSMRSVARVTKSIGTRFIAGGYSSNVFTTGEFHCEYIAASAYDAVRYCKDTFGLKPGPKKKQLQHA